MENIVNTSMNNLPRNWIFSLPETTGCVCSSGSPTPRPHVAVEACLCSSRNENAAPRLHEADRASEIKTQLRAKGKKKRDSSSLTLLILLLKTCQRHRHQQSDVTGRVTEGVICVWECEWMWVWQHKALSSPLDITVSSLISGSFKDCETGLDQLYEGMCFVFFVFLSGTY